MAKKVHKKKKRTSEVKKASHRMTFLFPTPDSGHLPDNYIEEFSEKTRSEDQQRISCIQAGTGQSSETVFGPGDYVVILEQGSFVRQINPNEFLQLELPAESTEIWYELYFQKKGQQVSGGIIIPASAANLIQNIHTESKKQDLVYLRMYLEKLGIRREKVSLRQDSPFEAIKGKSRFLSRLILSLTWSTSLAIKENRLHVQKKHPFSKENPLFRLAFLATIGIIFIILPILSLDSGMSGDDEKHYQHAAKVYRYYTEGDQSALDDPRNKLNFYGQSFDLFTYVIIRWFGLQDNAYEARHFMIALAGAAAILFTGLLVRLFAGSAGGLLAMLLMFLSPRFLGHSFNNPMDVPFLLGNIFTIYHLILFLKKLPRFSIWHALWIAVGIAWANGIRIGGLLLIPYIFMFSGLYLLIRKWEWKFFSRPWWLLALKGTGILILVSVAGYFLSLITWPYALQDVIANPKKAFEVMSDIQVSIRVLYDNTVHWSDALPWHYIPRNILLTVPAVILLGLFASPITWLLDRKKRYGYWYFLLWFTIIFPVIFIIIRESNVYGGWRHMMFIFPSIVALSAMSLTSLIKKIPASWIRVGACLLLAAGLIHPLKHIVANHPNTYIYYNEISGGINKTYGSYETDYYTNSLRPASDYFLEEILPGIEDSEDTLRVVSNAWIPYYFRNHRDRVDPFYSRYYDLGKYNWDYAVLYCNYIHPYHLNNGMWPPKNTIHEIKVDDVTVAAIVERRNRDDYHGTRLLEEAVAEQNGIKMDSALTLMEKAIDYDNSNAIAHLQLAAGYITVSMFDEARSIMERLLKVYPEYDKAFNTWGYSYLVQSQAQKNPALVDDAIHYFNKALASNYKLYSAYYHMGLAYDFKGDLPHAEQNFKKAIKYNGKFREAYERLGNLYEKNGYSDAARYYKERAARLR